MNVFYPVFLLLVLGVLHSACALVGYVLPFETINYFCLSDLLQIGVNFLFWAAFLLFVAITLCWCSVGFVFTWIFALVIGFHLTYFHFNNKIITPIPNFVAFTPKCIYDGKIMKTTEYMGEDVIRHEYHEVLSNMHCRDDDNLWILKNIDKRKKIFEDFMKNHTCKNGNKCSYEIWMFDVLLSYYCPRHVFYNPNSKTLSLRKTKGSIRLLYWAESSGADYVIGDDQVRGDRKSDHEPYDRYDMDTKSKRFLPINRPISLSSLYEESGNEAFFNKYGKSWGEISKEETIRMNIQLYSEIWTSFKKDYPEYFKINPLTGKRVEFPYSVDGYPYNFTGE